MTVRNKGLASQQTLVWNDENRLSQVQDSNGATLEQYWYDVDGARVKKTRGSTTTYTFFAHYEEEVTGGVTTVVSYYTFGGLRVAVKRGNTLYHLHGDHLGSTSLTTRGSAETANRADYAYGAERSATGDLKTDRTFTGQKRDSTGLMYYNARYYDPALGTFISPDSMVPGAGQVINYNRFLYAKGNPLKYTDPTGHAGYDPFSQDWIDAFKAEHGGEEPDAADRVDRLISLSHPGPVERKATWTEFDWHYYTRNKMWVLAGVISVTGIKIDRSWDVTDRKERDNLTLLLEGMIEFGYTVGKANGGGLEAGLAQLGEMLDGPTYWGRGASGWGLCAHSDTQACAPGRWVNFYDKLFNSGYDDTYIRTAVAHEMAHVLHNTSCATVMGMPKICELQFGLFLGIGFGLEGFGTYELTTEAQQNQWEYWAEAVTIWVYEDEYSTAQLGRGIGNEPDQIGYIERVFGK